MKKIDTKNLVKFLDYVAKHSKELLVQDHGLRPTLFISYAGEIVVRYLPIDDQEHKNALHNILLERGVIKPDFLIMLREACMVDKAKCLLITGEGPGINYSKMIPFTRGEDELVVIGEETKISEIFTDVLFDGIFQRKTVH
jgi:hypothetical protein